MTHNCDYLPHTFRFIFQLDTDFPFQFCVFITVKSPSVTQRSVFQENVFKKRKTYRLNYFRKTEAQIINT